MSIGALGRHRREGPGIIDTGFDEGRVARSCWFNLSDDQEQAFVAAGNSRTKRITGAWFRRQRYGVNDCILEAQSSSSAVTYDIFFPTDDRLEVSHVQGGYVYQVRTTQVFRDSEWTQVVVSVDTDEVTASDRIDIYVNGVLVTDFQTASYPSPSYAGGFFGAASVSHFFGSADTSYFNKRQVAQLFYLDGVSIQNGDHVIGDFGEATVAGNSTIWAPVADATIVGHANSAGGHSYALTSLIGDGTDASTNGNDFTPVSMSDALNGRRDSPSLNYCQFTPLDKGGSSAITFDNGNTKLDGATPVTASKGTLVISADDPDGYYWELRVRSMTSSVFHGVQRADGPLHTGQANAGEIVIGASGVVNADFCGAFLGARGAGGGNRWNVYFGDNGSGSADVGPTMPAFANGDILQFAVKGGEIWLGINNTWYDSTGASGAVPGVSGAVLSVGDDKQLVPHSCPYGGSGADVNFGDNGDFNGLATAGGKADANGFGDFFYAPPTGFLALNSANLASPVEQGNENFSFLVDDLTGGSVAVTGAGFQPDIFHVKQLNGTSDWYWGDRPELGTVRGMTTVTNAAELSHTDISVYGPDGYTTDSTVTTFGSLAASSALSFLLKAGGNAVVNNDGTISTDVSVAPAGHLSIVGWTGTQVGTDTIGHGLGESPELVIIKNRNGALAWVVTAQFLMGTGGLDYLYFHDIIAEGGAGAFSTPFITLPDADTIRLHYTAGAHINGSGNDMVAYCFKNVPGVFQVGMFKGDASADGPRVLCGFTPRAVVTKRMDSGSSWVLQNRTRDPYNPTDNYTLINTNGAEAVASALDIDLLAQGFKMRTTDGGMNGNNGRHLYMAFGDLAGEGALPPLPGV